MIRPRAGARSLAVLACVTLACVTLACVTLAGCGAARGARPAKSERPPDRVEALLARMTLAEKLGQLTQLAGAATGPDGPKVGEDLRDLVRRGEVGSFLGVYGARLTRELQEAAVESRLGIPLLFAFDVIHGFRTTFPVPLAEAASFDPAMIERAARVSAREASAVGLHWTFAPMVDVARDPRWGRIAEGAGEDPFLGAAVASARVRGLQGSDLAARDTILACAKHFVAYGAAEGGRDYNTAEVSERTLQEVYLPPFRAALDAGAATFMSAFNDVGGVPATANRRLLRGLLRGRWGFDGVVVSDWRSVEELIAHGVAADRAEAGRLAIEAGVDIDMVSEIYRRELAAEVRAGRVPIAEVDEAVRRVLRVKERLGLLDDPYRYSDPETERRVVLSADNRKTAREMAEESIVLLKNEGAVLPLSPKLEHLAVLGPLADDAGAALGPWSAPGRADDVVTVLAGLRAALPDAEIEHQPGVPIEGEDKGGIEEAVAAARRADAVVLVLGESAEMSGEAHSRSHLELPGAQLALARAVLAAGKPTAVVLMNGRPLAIPALAKEAPAIVEAWFLGVETGPAVAGVLLGRVNPSGKLPASFPRATGQVPVYYDHTSTGRPADPGSKWSSKYLDVPIGALYPFGHGLSYTRFELRDLKVDPAEVAPGGAVTVSVEVENAGDRAGAEVVQVYLHDPVASTTRPVLQLTGFRRVALEPGASRRVSFEVPARAAALWGRDHRFHIEPGVVEVSVGRSSADLPLRGRFEIAPGR